MHQNYLLQNTSNALFYLPWLSEKAALPSGAREQHLEAAGVAVFCAVAVRGRESMLFAGGNSDVSGCV
jgi:hypothetical protein